MSSQHDMKKSFEYGQSSSSVAISINSKLKKVSSSVPKYTIFKVHEFLRRENEMAYEPEILAIGPYHRGKPRLQVMEDLKFRWLKERLEQLGKSDASEYVEAMMSLEPKARQCYSESTSHVNAYDFAEMMLLDGCFLIQFMHRFCSYNSTDPFVEEWVMFSSIRDMLIFENQIPLFVLEKLFTMITLSDEESTNFREFALNFLNTMMRVVFSDAIPRNRIKSISPHGVHHILGFLHDLLRSIEVSNSNTNLADGETSQAKWSLPHATKLCEAGFKFIITRSCCRGQVGQRDRDGDSSDDILKLDIESIPCAAKLHAAGVQFRSKKAMSGPFEISFKDGVMEISTFSIGYEKESLYRNMIAYEEYNLKPSNRCVVLYVNFMGCLMDTAEDVALLRQCGIVHNALGDDGAVSTIFNNLGNHITATNKNSKVHSKLYQEVNAYYRKRRHRWMAKLRRDYFNSPWALISVFAAFFLLVLTLTQTVFSILGVL